MRCGATTRPGSLATKHTNPSLPPSRLGRSASLFDHRGQPAQLRDLGVACIAGATKGFGRWGMARSSQQPLVPVRVVGITNATALGAGGNRTPAPASPTARSDAGGAAAMASWATAATRPPRPVTVSGITTPLACQRRQQPHLRAPLHGRRARWGLNGFGTAGHREKQQFASARRGQRDYHGTSDRHGFQPFLSPLAKAPCAAGAPTSRAGSGTPRSMTQHTGYRERESAHAWGSPRRRHSCACSRAGALDAGATTPPPAGHQ